MHFLVKWCKASVERTSSLGEIERPMPMRYGEIGAVFGKATDMIMLMI